MKTPLRHLPLVALLPTASALAHPALFHGATAGDAAGAGFLHPFTGLDHLVVMVAIGLWAVQIGNRALWLLPGAFVGSMMLGGLIGFGRMPLEMVEHGILASIILLGAALGMAWRPPVALAALFAGLAGLCHGYAHGSEMPAGSLPLLYLAGMVAATCLLHAAGVGGGLLIGSGRKAIRVAGFLMLGFALLDYLYPVA
jgi:urease accessory protein